MNCIFALFVFRRHHRWRHLSSWRIPCSDYKCDGSHPDVSRNCQNKTVSIKHNLFVIYI